MSSILLTHICGGDGHRVVEHEPVDISHARRLCSYIV